MGQVFKISKLNKILYWSLLVGMSFYLIYMSSLSWGTGRFDSIVIPLAAAVIGALIFINQIKSKVIISDISIVKTNLFSKKELQLKNIKGFRIDYRTIVIEPVEQGYPRLVVRDYVSADGSQLLTQWLEKNLTDLDKK